jgi:hypothetical protein
MLGGRVMGWPFMTSPLSGAKWLVVSSTIRVRRLGAASATGYATIERGHRELTDDLATTLAAAFGCSTLVVRRAWTRSTRGQ